jgi:hypothetical protein
MLDNSQNKKVFGFKKFSEIENKSKLREIYPSEENNTDLYSDKDVNSNLPNNSSKIEKPGYTNDINKNEQDLNLDDQIKSEEKINNSKKVKTFGKIAKFPNNVKAHKAYNFLENIKVPKKSIWYIMIEKDNELQMVKYNYKEGVDLNAFVNDLKTYYLSKNKGNKAICESISKISVDGNDKYSIVKNIPLIELDGKKMITKITEDLIKLLSK